AEYISNDVVMPMRGITDYDKCYDRAFYYMWDFTTGQATSWRECYRGAKHYGRFLLSELDRKEKLEADGEMALARRGLVASEKIFLSWLFNIIEDCSQLRAPLPPELLEVLYRVFGCRMYNDSEPDPVAGAKTRFLSMTRNGRDVPVRATARELGVDPSQITRWKRNPPKDPLDCNMELYQEIRKRTQIDGFLIKGSEALRR
ncbi:MAG: hypothetical protein RLO21_19675, partial [Nitratireductor sp.]